jgi:hypothetical protein
LREPLLHRADALFKKLVAGQGLWSFLGNAAWQLCGRKKLSTWALEKLSSALVDQGLKTR